jgi:SsrA-binding protein
VAAGEKTVAVNRKARHDYEIVETFEAGIVLAGSEVKSLRAGQASIAEAFGRVNDGEVWLENLHIPPYSQASTHRTLEPRRPRKLLLHRGEIDRLVGKLKEKGFSLVPMRLYFKHGLAKIELGLGRGKRKYEKRQAIAEREHKREIEQAAGRRR